MLHFEMILRLSSEYLNQSNISVLISISDVRKHKQKNKMLVNFLL